MLCPYARRFLKLLLGREDTVLLRAGACAHVSLAGGGCGTPTSHLGRGRVEAERLKLAGGAGGQREAHALWAGRRWLLPWTSEAGFTMLLVTPSRESRGCSCKA